ncbi:MAG: UDP-N-acetylmuramoyl-L-alanine--D-glutamate ligase [Candidatus Shapirobacteria bacterium]
MKKTLAWQNKKVAVLGLGLEGRDVVDCLLPQRAEISVYDLDPKIKKVAGVKFFLGEKYLDKGLTGYDYVFRSPAFKPSLPEIRAAEEAGVVVTSATKLFFETCPGKIIGVTGTKGKGTTATLIYEILKAAGKQVYLAGNVGLPVLSLLPKLDLTSWVVLELSSFQLMDMEKSPAVAVVLFITSEHLDYHTSTEEYVQAKAHLVRYQGINDWAVLNLDNAASASFACLTPAKKVFFSRRRLTNGAYVGEGDFFYQQESLGKTGDLLLRGQHNWENVAAAITTAKIAGVSTQTIKDVVFSFKGLEHRLELAAEKEGVSFYNDSFSTTPETTIAAVRSFKEAVILIAGGSDKGSDYGELGKEIAQSSVRALILVGLMAEKIQKAVLEAGFRGKILFRPLSLRQAVAWAKKEAREHEVVLLSPACASFDQFKNYKDRGEQFKKYVQAL